MTHLYIGTDHTTSPTVSKPHHGIIAAESTTTTFIQHHSHRQPLDIPNTELQPLRYDVLSRFCGDKLCRVPSRFCGRRLHRHSLSGTNCAKHTATRSLELTARSIPYIVCTADPASDIARDRVIVMEFSVEVALHSYHIGEMGLVIINVPEWDHFVMRMMTAAVTTGYPLHHIECAMTTPAKTSIYRLCLCLFGLFWAHFCCQLCGDCPFASLTMNITTCINAQFECVDYICEGHLIDLCGLNVDRSPG